MRIILSILIGLSLQNALPQKVASEFLRRTRRGNTWHHTEELSEGVVECWFMKYRLKIKHFWFSITFSVRVVDRISVKVQKGRTVTDTCNFSFS